LFLLKDILEKFKIMSYLSYPLLVILYQLKEAGNDPLPRDNRTTDAAFLSFT